MNETIKTLLSRRSVRCYAPKQITEEELHAIVKAGLHAPSAMNHQSWHLTVIQNEAVLQKIVNVTKSVLHLDNSPFYGAPTLILVFANQNAEAPAEDASLALGNMMNAATSLGVASCWIHSVRPLFDTKEGQVLKKEFGIPKDYAIVGSVVLGYNAGATPSAPKRKEGSVQYIK